MKAFRNAIALAIPLLFVACGGITGNTDCNFTVGGVISGLPSGLKFTLLYNGGSPETISSNGPFALTQRVTLGTAYSLTIGTQPQGYRCTVTGGSGTVTSTQQSGVAISCTDAGVTLGGTIAGLADRSGLSLTDGVDSISPNPGDTSFSFPTPLPAGTAYSISVASQPAGGICSVAGGTGTTGSANDANAVVTCSQHAFTLGGTLQGLTVSGLVLANGSDTITVSSGATAFTMPTPVAYSSSYALSVMTQPVGLACAVSHGTGTMPANNVSTVAVTCTAQPFGLGGTISGLGNNTGLVLANGSDTLTVMANATVFTMPTGVPFASAYAVTVQTSPPGLTCTLTNGSGTMPAVNVTDIVITCADQSYTVGGSVSGLTASGLVLVNGSDTLSVVANSTSFTMPTAIAFGSHYAVTVQTQPANFTCTVSNGSGTMGVGLVTNVAVTCAQSAFTIGGSISGLTGSGLVLGNGTDTLSVLTNATTFTMPTGVADGATYHVTVQTNPAALACLVTNGAGTVGGANVTNIAITCAPGATFTNGQAASVVIGQDVFTTKTSGTSATTLVGPWGGVSLNQGIIYITDYGNSRILGYDSIPTQNGAAADFVIGETNLNSGSNGTSASTFYYPWANSIYATTMVVADAGNNRVLLFSPVPTATGASASFAVGQSSMTAYASGCTASTLYHPAAAMAAAGKLVVADYYNNRILIWNTIPSSNAVAADIVVGQPNMTTCAINTGGISSSSLRYPADVWTDGTRLIVADSGNNRVLVWNALPTSNNVPADIVIGQASFSASSANQGGSPSAATLYSSYSSWSSVTSNGSQIFISDYNNNRVVIFNSIPTANGAAADNVLGQPDFTSNSAANPPTASSLNGVGGVSVHGSQFFLTDYGNNRVLIYDGH